MKKSTISRIYDLSRSSDIPPTARMALFADLKEVSKLKRTLRPRVQKAKLVEVRKIGRPKPFVKLCKLCKAPIPHRDKAVWSQHMRMVGWRSEWKARDRYRARVGYGDLIEASVRARRNRALRLRTAIFKEIAPRAGAILGDDAIAKLANARRFGVTRYLEPLERWRKFVRKHYLSH